MKNSFLKLLIDTILGMVFFFILPLVSLFAVPEIAFKLSGGNKDIAVWTALIYSLLLLAVIITLCRWTHER
jgi:hypothetical protein